MLALRFYLSSRQVLIDHWYLLLVSFSVFLNLISCLQLTWKTPLTKNRFLTSIDRTTLNQYHRIIYSTSAIPFKKTFFLSPEVLFIFTTQIHQPTISCYFHGDYLIFCCCYNQLLPSFVFCLQPICIWVNCRSKLGKSGINIPNVNFEINKTGNICIDQD